MIWNSELKKDLETVSREVKAAQETIKQARQRTKKEIANLTARVAVSEGYLKTIAGAMTSIAKQLEAHTKKVEEIFGGVVVENTRLEAKSSDDIQKLQDAMNGILDTGNLGYPQ